VLRDVGRCGGGSRHWGAALLAIAAAVLSVGCGARGHGAETDSSKASDAEILNTALAQELTTAGAYKWGLPLLKGEALAVAVKFQAQEQECVDAITKAIRGVGGDATAEKEEVDFSTVHDEKGFLALAYELESRSLRWDLAAEPHVFTPAPTSLIAGLAVGHGQHLVILRQALGEGRTGSVPNAFDGGKVPLPEGAAPSSPTAGGDGSATTGGSGGGG
jgi:hypothetical protein